MDRGAWRVAVCGVTQRKTGLLPSLHCPSPKAFLARLAGKTCHSLYFYRNFKKLFWHKLVFSHSANENTIFSVLIGIEQNPLFHV